MFKVAEFSENGAIAKWSNALHSSDNEAYMHVRIVILRVQGFESLSHQIYFCQISFFFAAAESSSTLEPSSAAIRGQDVLLSKICLCISHTTFRSSGHVLCKFVQCTTQILQRRRLEV